MMEPRFERSGAAKVQRGWRGDVQQDVVLMGILLSPACYAGDGEFLLQVLLMFSNTMQLCVWLPAYVAGDAVIPAHSATS